MRPSAILLTITLPVLHGLLAGCEEAHTPPANQDQGPAKSSEALPEEISFNEHIQPILSEYCYHCHGPDSGTREPKDLPLRLDLPEDALADRGDNPPVIIPGKPGESEIIRLMRSNDPDVIMSPPNSHKVINSREIALMEEWVLQGAEYEAHWSFLPIEKPESPAAHSSWGKGSIDSFVLARLAENKLSPNLEESPRRLHRRMCLDLTGLPPKPEETDRFEEDFTARGDTALADEADRLLATKASAEHFTRHWLDAARYADTHGIHIDNSRAIWPYRDWVVCAFEANMPWDQFTLEQIAGDLIPERTLDQLVATGFSRCLATTGEGGAIPEEYEAIYAKDRVDTVSAIWLGLTTGCASCHDHKFDPISMKEFYSLAAFFRNTTMRAMDGNNAEHPPNVFVPIPEDREAWSELANKLTSVEKELAERRKTGEVAWQTWRKEAKFAFNANPDPTLEISLPLNEPDGPLRGMVKKQQEEWSTELKRIDGPFGPVPVITDQSIELGDLASFSREDQITVGGYFRMAKHDSGALIGRINPGDNHRGWKLAVENGHPVFLISQAWKKGASKFVVRRKLPANKWFHLVITFNWMLSAPTVATANKWFHLVVTFNGKLGSHQVATMYLDGKRFGAKADPNSVGGRIESKVPLRIGSRADGTLSFTTEVAMQDFRYYERMLSPQEIGDLHRKANLKKIVSTPAEKRDKTQQETLKNYFFKEIDPASVAIHKRINAIKFDQKLIKKRGSVSLVMQEKDTEPFAHMLARGVYSDKGEKVSPNTPAVLPPMPVDAPKNRLGLAKWLNDPTNPLPARVIMNRAWHTFFGTGIVESNDDFGIMGSRPSHPKLLDWLAAEFIESGWNYRHMVKLIVTSATYRQSGSVTPEKLEKDPFNRLLSRGPRIRLDAEPIRDLALAASGLLSSRAGGPPAKPYQPEGIWSAVAMPQSNTRNYKQDSGEVLYRRSLYWFWKRTTPPATMEIFNAPSREVFCVRRDLTNTPLQALALMNDPQFVEASRVLATKAIEFSKKPAERIDFITRRLINRSLDETEMPIVLESLDDFEATYNDDEEAAAKLIRVGETPTSESIKPTELAAWTMVASQILNLDETITR